MAQKKPHFALAYAITGAIDVLQFVGGLIPAVDFIVIPADAFLDIAIGFGIGWWAKRIGALDATGILAIGVTFLTEEAFASETPFWIVDIGILHLKYKAIQAATQLSLSKQVSMDGSTPPNQNGRCEPTAAQPRNQGGRHEPLVVK